MQTIVDRFFAAMQTQGQDESDLLALFADDAAYVEPFSGKPRAHDGKAAIRAAFREGWKQKLPEMHIEVDTVTVKGEELVAEWTCRSPALPGGEGRGINLFTLRDGLVVRLETRFLP